MNPIVVPKPKSVWNPNRPASSLLLAQVHHLREAEKNLPGRYHTGIFHKALVTEGDVARYVKVVTEAIHRAHAEAAQERVRAAAKAKAPKRHVIEIAAAADEAAERKKKARSKKKKPRKKGGRRN